MMNYIMFYIFTRFDRMNLCIDGFKMNAEQQKSRVLVIIGSASKNSSNSKLMEAFRELAASEHEVTILDNLETLPHFDPAGTDDPPPVVKDIRTDIASASGVIFCSPEYIFSIPARLKNLLEWCVSTTIFLEKPVGIITASADGHYGHEELKLIARTLGAQLHPDAELLLKGIKEKLDNNGLIKDTATVKALQDFSIGFRKLIDQ